MPQSRQRTGTWSFVVLVDGNCTTVNLAQVKHKSATILMSSESKRELDDEGT